MFNEASVSFEEQSTDHLFYQAANNALLSDDKWSAVWQTLLSNADLNYSDAREPVSLASRITGSTSSIYSAITEGWTCAIGFSGGKDSTSVLHLFLMALMRAVRNGTNVSQYHFIQTADTLIENPEMHHHSKQVLSRLQTFIDEHNLPLTIIVARPSLTQSWVGRILTGRGLPTYTNSSTRQCSNDLKIIPLRQAKARYLKGLPVSVRNKVCLMLGSRDDEGARRASNIARMGGSSGQVTLTPHGGELYPVKDWRTEDIWAFLTECGSDARFPLPSFQPDNFAITELYKDATGECIWSPDKKTTGSSACGARYGCAICTAVGIDRTMETLINNNPEKYGYQSGLNRLQRYLSKIQYDWSKRDYIGRTLFEGGYVRLQPNVFSSSLTERLFHVCCSLDYVEAKRAAELREKLLSGEVADTPHNRRMSEPQFCLVEEKNVIHVDFMWSVHCFSPVPFKATEIYRRVWEDGDLDLLDDEPALLPVARTPMPAPLWMRIPGRSIDSEFGGLADPLTAMSYFDGQNDPRASRELNTANGQVSVVSFAEEDEVTVDEDTASWIIWHEYDELRQRVSSGEFTACSTVQYLLRYGAVRLAKGKGSIYHRLAERGQYYQRHGLSDKQPLEELVASRRFKIISDKRYRRTVAQKLRGQAKKLMFWSCVAICAELHMQNRTALGEWLINQLNAELEHQQFSVAYELRRRLTDSLLTVCNLRLQGYAGRHQAATDRHYYRLARKQSLSSILRCLNSGNTDVIQEVLWDLRLLLNPSSTERTGFLYVDNQREKLYPLLKSYLRRFLRLHRSIAQ
ncbi:phosphoadenosine phosphosulfate reductase family protein [Escherichia coli]|nr:phosphoadenosine phosphosulfate reductase family protein [Escherichia coli]